MMMIRERKTKVEQYELLRKLLKLINFSLSLFLLCASFQASVRLRSVLQRHSSIDQRSKSECIVRRSVEDRRIDVGRFAAGRKECKYFACRESLFLHI